MLTQANRHFWDIHTFDGRAESAALGRFVTADEITSRSAASQTSVAARWSFSMDSVNVSLKVPPGKVTFRSGT